jgi:hypothetical protein
MKPSMTIGNSQPLGKQAEQKAAGVKDQGIISGGLARKRRLIRDTIETELSAIDVIARRLLS